jgi:hypothetical protein
MIGKSPKRNEYIDRFGGYEKIPKSVWAAIAISFARRLNNDDEKQAYGEIFTEWSILHQNGIIPQKPFCPGDLAPHDQK